MVTHNASDVVVRVITTTIAIRTTRPSMGDDGRPPDLLKTGPWWRPSVETDDRVIITAHPTFREEVRASQHSARVAVTVASADGQRRGVGATKLAVGSEAARHRVH
jgi:hypothetical protein